MTEKIKVSDDISIVKFVNEENHVYQIEIHSILDSTVVTVYDHEIAALIKELTEVQRLSGDK